MTVAYFTVISKRDGEGFHEGCRYVVVEVRGVKYRVNVNKGKRVRLAFSAKKGHQWDADVLVFDTGRHLWGGMVTKGIGVVRLLELAGVIPHRPERRAELERDLQIAREYVARFPNRDSDYIQMRRDFIKEAEATLKLDDELLIKFKTTEAA